TDSMAFSGGRVVRRLDPGTLRAERSPDGLVAKSRTAGATRQIAPAYERLTFDKSIATRPRRSDEEAKLPQAELCGPGHPLFDALVESVMDRTTAEVRKGTIFFDPDATEPTILHFLLGDVLDGNNEVVRRTLATLRVWPDGRVEPGPVTSLFDVVPPTTEVGSRSDDARGRP